MIINSTGHVFDLFWCVLFTFFVASRKSSWPVRLTHMAYMRFRIRFRTVIFKQCSGSLIFIQVRIREPGNLNYGSRWSIMVRMRMVNLITDPDLARPFLWPLKRYVEQYVIIKISYFVTFNINLNFFLNFFQSSNNKDRDTDPGCQLAMESAGSGTLLLSLQNLNFVIWWRTLSYSFTFYT